MDREEGQKCNISGCAGIIDYPKVENCSCHINPPCAGCTDRPLRCQECGWEEKIEFMNDFRMVVNPTGAIESYRPRALDKTKIDWRTQSHTNSSQKCIGVYPEGTEREQVEELVKGTFGGRFERFDKGEFEYIAYTD